MKILLSILFYMQCLLIFGQSFSFSYDDAGNRIHWEVIELKAYENYADTSTTAQITIHLGEMKNIKMSMQAKYSFQRDDNLVLKVNAKPLM